MGRPKKEIDKTQFEKLCGLQCTKEEIAGFFECSDETLEKWVKRTYGCHFLEVFTQKRCTGKISLRRAQWRMAETIPTMAIWLGKQYLGQADRQEIAVSLDNDVAVKEMEAYFDKQKADTGSFVEQSN